MANIPPLKRFSIEDFKDQASWIFKLFSPLNDFMSSVVAALNNGLTFSQNMNAQVKEIDVSVHASGTYPIKYQSTVKGKPIGLWVVNVLDKAASPATLTTAVYCDWTFRDGQIVINNITGLTVGEKYRITINTIGG